MSVSSLTQMQLLGIGSATNVAEGYPSFAPTPSQAAILDRLPELMARALSTPYPELELAAHAAFFSALGQESAPLDTGRLLSFYSSTVAIDVAAAALARRVDRVGLVHPVIDCIPALLRRRGLEVLPVAEQWLRDGTLFDEQPDIQAVVAANPNNPTGDLLTPVELERLALACAERGAPLVLDQCFRAFDTRVQYDTYSLLDATGVEYVIIEDTGKLWPTAGVKLGFLAMSASARLDIAEVSADVLLVAPPFSTVVVAEFARDMADGGLAMLHERIAANRAVVGAVFEGSDRAVQADGDSRVSVSMLQLAPGVTSTRLWGQLLREGVHTVPCRPFWWAAPQEGERYLRIALARETEVVQRAAVAVRSCLERP